MLRKLWFNFIYYKKPNWDTGISPDELLDFIGSQSPGRALDLGCGTGTNVITLARHGWQVTGVDFSWRAIQIARKKALHNNVIVDLRIEDVMRLESITGSFDFILDIGCFHSLPSSKRPAYLHSVDRLLTDAGTFLLYMFFRSSSENPALGVSESEILLITQKFKLLDRLNGTERGMRPSAWLTLQKK